MEKNRKKSNSSSSIENEISGAKSYGTIITTSPVKVQRHPGVEKLKFNLNILVRFGLSSAWSRCLIMAADKIILHYFISLQK